MLVVSARVPSKVYRARRPDVNVHVSPGHKQLQEVRVMLVAMKEAKIDNQRASVI